MNPFGLVAVIGLLAVGTDSGRAIFRTAFRATVLAGYTAKESVSDLVVNLKDGCAGVMADVKSDIASAKEEATARAKPKKPHKVTNHDSDSSENYV